MQMILTLEKEKGCTHISENKHEGTEECNSTHIFVSFHYGNVRAVEPQFNFPPYSHVRNCMFCVNDSKGL